MQPETKVPVTIAGRDLYLRYSLGALAEAQRAAGLPTLAALLGKVDELETAIVAAATDYRALYTFDLGGFNALVWAGTLEARRDQLTVQELAGAIQPYELVAIALAVVSAIALAWTPPKAPEPAKDGAPANPPAAAA